MPFVDDSFPVFSRKNLVISKKNCLEEEEEEVAPSPLLEETTTGVDDELEGAAGEISLGADAHAPIMNEY